MANIVTNFFLPQFLLLHTNLLHFPCKPSFRALPPPYFQHLLPYIQTAL